jgi:hypothetical protein
VILRTANSRNRKQNKAFRGMFAAMEAPRINPPALEAMAIHKPYHFALPDV